MTPTTTMMAFCLRAGCDTPVLEEEMPIPTPRAGEALIRVLRAGVCGTDLAMINQYKAGFEGPIGHEFVGIVHALGEHSTADAHWLGQRVVGEINVPCDDVQRCCVCRAYHTRAQKKASHESRELEEARYRNHCPNRDALGIVGRAGAFAEFLTLPIANLVRVPDHVPDAHAVFAEPVAAACRIVEQRIIQPTDSVVVLGDGRLGLLVAEVLAARRVAAKISLVGKHTSKMALLDQIVDAQILYHPNVAETHHGAFDVCVECTGTPSGLVTAVALVKPVGGCVIVKSTCATKTSQLPAADLQTSGLRFVGSRCGPFGPAMELLASGRLQVGKYIEASFPLAQAHDGIARARQRGALKVQLVVASADASEARDPTDGRGE
ncbi:hypothetical protein ATCC90586_008203 [Pythium insidiosum]|nr:hypothetical protein ATCC90586_008203 [Pythium insidiosum]